MSTDPDVHDSIDRAAEVVGPAWPLHSFVTANPLAGFEDRPFHEAVRAGERLFGGDGYPSAAVFRRAWADGRIDPDVLEAELTEAGYDADPERLLDRMADADDEQRGPDAADGETPTDRVDRVLSKWLAAFLDEGTAHWPMPDREAGFYAAVRTVAPHDRGIPDGERLAELPDEPVAAVEELLADHPRERWPAIFEHQLAALPGWTGLVRQRVDDGGPWQDAHPITLAGYLAVRLALSERLGAPIAPPEDVPAVDADRDDRPLPAVWLSAWEATYRRELVDAVTEASAAREAVEGGGRPDAQLVFCIDTRSEVVRRHVEAAGDYETHGYAGFFGVPMRYEGYDADAAVDACPPIVDAEHRIAERPTRREQETRASHDRWRGLLDAGRDVVDALTTNAATAFNFVESAGGAYGAALAARTLLPGRVYDLLAGVDERVPHAHEFCEPTVDYNPDSVHDLRAGLTHEEKVEYAAAAFDLMGIERFGRLFAFVGHASQTANNPFDASLDCGACAGNPGGPSARVLAAICNDPDVRASLRERGHDVPDDTVFVAGQHNTTTDEIALFDGDVPESHEADLARLREDLAEARAGAAAERAASMGDGSAHDDPVRETERRAADWAETRPEWGLAGNAAFVVGPRGLTADLDLDGRSFLHSYDWTTDPDGDALAEIMAGPMVVTQWINTQYYFATVDPGVYGSGSKVTHNPVGNVGVYQGNGGDLTTGLPLQSVHAAADDPYHQPLRLSAVVHAPVDRVTGVLAGNDQLARLLDNGWLSLTVVDPEQDHGAFEYDGELAWRRVDATPEPQVAAPAPTTGD